MILVRLRLYKLKKSLVKTILELNIFKNHLHNDRQLRYQRNGTRLYILFIAISLAILSCYLLLRKEIHHETILNPTESHYIHLQQTYPHSLSCPCNSISMPYSTFITIERSIHQICSSDLISSQWIEYTGSYIRLGLATYNLDYRSSASGQFRLLAILCQQTQQTINDSLQVFLQTQLIGSQIIPQQLFESQINSTIQDWQSITIDRFLRTRLLMHAINQGNNLSNNAFNYRYITLPI